MAEERKILLEIEVDRKGAKKQLDENLELLELNRAELSNLNKAYKDGEIDVADYAKAKFQVTEENKKLSSANRELIKQLNTEDNSLNALRMQLSRLTAERNNTNQATEEGQKRFQELQKQILSTTNAIKEQEEAGGDFRRSVGNYGKALEGAVDDTKVFGVSLGGIKSQLLGLINPFTATITAVGALGAAYIASGRGSDDLERASNRLNSVMNELNNSVADLVGATESSGPLDKALAFLQLKLLGVGSVIRSNIVVAVRESIKQFKLLEVQSRGVGAELLKQVEIQKQIRDDETQSIDDRIQANIRIQELIRERAEQEITLQEEQVRNQRTLLNLDKGNIDIQIELAKSEQRLAEIRSEAETKLTEAKIKEIALNKQLNADLLALTTARINEELILVEKGTQKELDLKFSLIDQQEKILLEQAGQNEQRRLTIAQNANNERLQLFIDYQNSLVDIEKLTGDEIFKTRTALDKKLVKIDEKAIQRKLKNLELEIEMEKLKNENIIAGVAFISGALSGFYEQNTIAYKAFASIEAAISTYLAINKSLAAVPPPAGIPLAVGIGIQGFANVAKINGLIGGRGASVDSGGAARQLEQPGSRTSLTGAFDRNQLTGDANSQQGQITQINNALANQPAPVVRVTDINKVQQRTNNVKVNNRL